MSTSNASSGTESNDMSANQDPTVAQETKRVPPVMNTPENPASTLASHSPAHGTQSQESCEWSSSLPQNSDITALGDREHSHVLNAIASTSKSVALKLGDNLQNEVATPDRKGQDEEQSLVDHVCKELRVCDPMVRDVICRLINIPGVDITILKRAASLSSEGPEGEGIGRGGGEASQRRHPAPENTGSDLHSDFVSGLGCGGGGRRDDQFAPKALSGRYANFVGLEEQPKNGAQRTLGLTTEATASNSMIVRFSEDYGEQQAPSRGPGKEEVDECDALLMSSLQTKPTEETFLSSLLSSDRSVMEETQLGAHTIFVPKSPVAWPPNMQGPTVGVTQMSSCNSIARIPDHNMTATPLYDPMSQPLLLDFQRLHGYRSVAESNRRKFQNLLELLSSSRCKPAVKQLFLPYSVNKKNTHGLALIIVNEFHPDDPQRRALPHRQSAIADVKHLSELWELLGYRVRVETDKTTEQIKRLFDEIREDGDPAKTIQEGDNSFVCCISSHGTWDPALGTDVIYGVDGIQREDNQIVKGALDIKALAMEKLSPFKTGCPKLKGRPKIFIIQTCRGGRHDRTISVYDPRTDCLPELDFLFIFSTAPGKLSYRNDPYGSFFITDLCGLLALYANTRDLISILQAVIVKETALDEPYILRNDKGDIVEIVRQCPNYISSLCGPVFFTNKARRQYKRLVLS